MFAVFATARAYASQEIDLRIFIGTSTCILRFLFFDFFFFFFTYCDAGLSLYLLFCRCFGCLTNRTCLDASMIPNAGELHSFPDDIPFRSPDL